MNTNKSLSEQVNDILKQRMSVNKKVELIVKLGVTPREALILARASMRTATARVQDFTFTFGVEIETCDCRPYDFVRAAQGQGLAIVDHTSQYAGCHTDIPQFKLVPDGSLQGSNTAECVTPALRNTADGFESLERCCRALREVGARVNSSCGLHVHIGARDLTDRAFCNVFVNYMMLETAIESFLAPSRRGSHARWCASLRNNESMVLGATTKQEMRQALRYDRYHRVNAEAYDRHQTIEFRQHQGSVNYKKIAAWVRFLGKLVEWSRSNRLTGRVDHIEDIPFLNETEKNYFCSRRREFTAL